MDPEDQMDYAFVNLAYWQNSINKFYNFLQSEGFSPEQFFEAIRMKNKALESIEDVEINEEPEETSVVVVLNGGGVNLINDLPNELLAHCIFRHLPLKQFFKCS